MSARRLAAAAGAAAALLAGAAPALADWGPGADVLSVDNVRGEQGDSATQFAQVSDQGRYVVMQTKSTNFFGDGDPDPPGLTRAGGVFRYDRDTGGIALVADGDFLDEDDGAVVLRGAANPSISADGRYVVFSTAQKLAPQDVNDNIDVYRRDMDVPLAADRAAGGAYTLVSAKDGGDVAPDYPPRDTPVPGRNPGSQVWPGTAISADGNVVAFRTADTASDLPDRPTADTPAQEVLVRDIAARRTVLLTRDSTTREPVGGSFGPVVLSRDGSTVAWVGQQAPRQTRFLPGEVLDSGANFYLWRRWADPGATTRRVTGVSDPDDPACPPGAGVGQSPTATGPCYGPLTSPEEFSSSNIGSAAPALSGDGYRVAFLAAGGARPQGDVNPGLDLWMTSMRDGVTRKAGTRELTRDATQGNPRASGQVSSVAMSADGDHLAFTTGRSAFLLTSPTAVGPFHETGTASVGGEELYALDLGADQITRVLFSADGGDADGGALANPTLSSNGGLIAFTSPATNLFFGDANQQPDAFVVSHRVPPAAAPPPAGTQVKPGIFSFDSPTGAIARTLSAKAHRRADGSVVLEIRTPAAGKVAVVATERKPPKKKATAKKKSSKKAKKSAAATVAKVTATAKDGKTLTVVLKAKGRFATTVKKGGSVLAKAVVTFVPAKGTTRHKTVDVTFRKAAKKAASKKSRKAVRR